MKKAQQMGEEDKLKTVLKREKLMQLQVQTSTSQFVEEMNLEQLQAQNSLGLKIANLQMKMNQGLSQIKKSTGEYGKVLKQKKKLLEGLQYIHKSKALQRKSQVEEMVKHLQQYFVRLKQKDRQSEVKVQKYYQIKLNELIKNIANQHHESHALTYKIQELKKGKQKQKLHMRAMIEELRKSMKKIKDIEGELVVFQSEYKKTILELKRKNSVKFLRLRQTIQELSADFNSQIRNEQHERQILKQNILEFFEALVNNFQ